MSYVAYLPATGEICMWGGGDLPDSLPQDWVALEGEGSAQTHYVDAGALVAYTPEQAAAKALAPDFPAAWSNETFAWVDQRTFAQAQADKWAEIKAARDAEINGGVVWDGSRFDSDETSRGFITSAFVLAGNPTIAAAAFPKLWKLSDNTTRMLSATDVVDVGMALNTLVQGCMNQGDALLTQINAAQTLAQIDVISWSAVAP